ncbi:MAG: DUF1573 domain-containing protein [Chitinophagales bacterium]|nr:DUF1573 domain-containing protein [Chitinophagales bacterium]MDW8420229.1 DUF1573 domain-containing protein [Chitinophagales bacterium]
MLRHFTLMILLTLGALYLSAQNTAPAEGSNPAPNPNAPKITFKEEVYNFGEVPEGPAVTHEFKFTNTGREPLVLSNVKASCGCTTPHWTKEPVLPGKEGVITVTYNTQGRPGPFSKTVTITSNADEPTKIITIKGEVMKDDPSKSVPIVQPSMLAPKN